MEKVSAERYSTLLINNRREMNMHAYINESMAELRARLRDIGMLPIRLIKVGYDTRRIYRKCS